MDPRAALAHDLATLPAELRGRLDAAGFDDAWLYEVAATLHGSTGDAAARRDARNRITGTVRGPSPEQVPPAPERGTPEGDRLWERGDEMIARGELALCVMAGGMATRMGGVVKALVEALPGATFLSMRLTENAKWSWLSGRPVPLWLMTSEATDAPIAEALKAHNAPKHVARFKQNLGLRLTPDGQLFREGQGTAASPSEYATGHGDLPDALRRSGLLQTFRATGGKYVWIANLDNLGATIDPAILGHFAETAKDVMVEVCAKVPGDRGGIPAWAKASPDAPERLQVLEEFRLPKTFDAATVPVFNTNTFLVKADALDERPVKWSWFEVEKQVDGKPAVQFERLLQELTAAMDAAYVTVPRDGILSRFLPVKDFDELARRRADIEAVVRARGLLK